MVRHNMQKFNYEFQPDKKTAVNSSLEQNIGIVKKTLADCDDMVYREFKIGGPDGTDAFLFYVDGLSDKKLIDSFVTTPLMITSRIVKPDHHTIVNCLAEVAKATGLTASDFKENGVIEEVIGAALSGECALLIDEYDQAIVIAAKSWPARSVAEPATEIVVRGAREGFTETMRTNTALVRRRIRDPRFKISQRQIGQRSKTDVALLYVEDIVDKNILNELNQRLDRIDIDAVLDSGYIEQFIEGNSYTPFPQTQTTERPDTVAAAIYEGRIGILVDNSPFALIVPTTLTAFLQSPEDYAARSLISTFIRLIRLAAGIISVLAPALYIAITSFNPGVIPSELALSIAATREAVPFPAFIEAIIMEFTFELLREAGVRLPRAIGSTIGIVGGLVIGQAAVSANIVSPFMVIVVAITAISSFAIPNYDLSAAFRLVRFFMMVAAAIYGLYGIVLVAIVVLMHMANIKSFDVPYLAPLAPYQGTDMKDMLLRVPWTQMKDRPAHYGSKNRRRQGS